MSTKTKFIHIRYSKMPIPVAFKVLDDCLEMTVTDLIKKNIDNSKEAKDDLSKQIVESLEKLLNECKCGLNGKEIDITTTKTKDLDYEPQGNGNLIADLVFWKPN